MSTKPRTNKPRPSPPPQGYKMRFKPKAATNYSKSPNSRTPSSSHHLSSSQRFSSKNPNESITKAPANSVITHPFPSDLSNRPSTGYELKQRLSSDLKSFMTGKDAHAGQINPFKMMEDITKKENLPSTGTSPGGPEAVKAAGRSVGGGSGYPERPVIFKQSLSKRKTGRRAKKAQNEVSGDLGDTGTIETRTDDLEESSEASFSNSSPKIHQSNQNEHRYLKNSISDFREARMRNKDRIESSEASGMVQPAAYPERYDKEHSPDSNLPPLAKNPKIPKMSKMSENSVVGALAAGKENSPKPIGYDSTHTISPIRYEQNESKMEEMRLMRDAMENVMKNSKVRPFNSSDISLNEPRGLEVVRNRGNRPRIHDFIEEEKTAKNSQKIKSSSGEQIQGVTRSSVDTLTTQSRQNQTGNLERTKNSEFTQKPISASSSPTKAGKDTKSSLGVFELDKSSLLLRKNAYEDDYIISKRLLRKRRILGHINPITLKFKPVCDSHGIKVFPDSEMTQFLDKKVFFVYLEKENLEKMVIFSSLEEDLIRPQRLVSKNMILGQIDQSTLRFIPDFMPGPGYTDWESYMRNKRAFYCTVRIEEDDVIVIPYDERPAAKSKPQSKKRGSKGHQKKQSKLKSYIYKLPSKLAKKAAVLGHIDPISRTFVSKFHKKTHLEASNPQNPPKDTPTAPKPKISSYKLKKVLVAHIDHNSPEIPIVLSLASHDHELTVKLKQVTIIEGKINPVHKYFRPTLTVGGHPIYPNDKLLRKRNVIGYINPYTQNFEHKNRDELSHSELVEELLTSKVIVSHLDPRSPELGYVIKPFFEDVHDDVALKLSKRRSVLGHIHVASRKFVPDVVPDELDRRNLRRLIKHRAILGYLDPVEGGFVKENLPIPKFDEFDHRLVGSEEDNQYVLLGFMDPNLPTLAQILVPRVNDYEVDSEFMKIRTFLGKIDPKTKRFRPDPVLEGLSHKTYDDVLARKLDIMDYNIKELPLVYKAGGEEEGLEQGELVVLGYQSSLARVTRSLMDENREIVHSNTFESIKADIETRFSPKQAEKIEEEPESEFTSEKKKQEPYNREFSAGGGGEVVDGFEGLRESLRGLKAGDGFKERYERMMEAELSGLEVKETQIEEIRQDSLEANLGHFERNEVDERPVEVKDDTKEVVDVPQNAQNGQNGPEEAEINDGSFGDFEADKAEQSHQTDQETTTQNSRHPDMSKYNTERAGDEISQESKKVTSKHEIVKSLKQRQKNKQRQHQEVPLSVPKPPQSAKTIPKPQKPQNPNIDQKRHTDMPVRPEKEADANRFIKNHQSSEIADTSEYEIRKISKRKRIVRGADITLSPSKAPSEGSNSAQSGSSSDRNRPIKYISAINSTVTSVMNSKVKRRPDASQQHTEQGEVPSEQGMWPGNATSTPKRQETAQRVQTTDGAKRAKKTVNEAFLVKRRVSGIGSPMEKVGRMQNAIPIVSPRQFAVRGTPKVNNSAGGPGGAGNGAGDRTGGSKGSRPSITKLSLQRDLIKSQKEISRFEGSFATGADPADSFGIKREPREPVVARKPERVEDTQEMENEVENNILGSPLHLESFGGVSEVKPAENEDRRLSENILSARNHVQTRFKHRDDLGLKNEPKKLKNVFLDKEIDEHQPEPIQAPEVVKNVEFRPEAVPGPSMNPYLRPMASKLGGGGLESEDLGQSKERASGEFGGRQSYFRPKPSPKQPPEPHTKSQSELRRTIKVPEGPRTPNQNMQVLAKKGAQNPQNDVHKTPEAASNPIEMPLGGFQLTFSPNLESTQPQEPVQKTPKMDKKPASEVQRVTRSTAHNQSKAPEAQKTAESDPRGMPITKPKKRRNLKNLHKKRKPKVSTAAPIIIRDNSKHKRRSRPSKSPVAPTSQSRSRSRKLVSKVKRRAPRTSTNVRDQRSKPQKSHYSRSRSRVSGRSISKTGGNNPSKSPQNREKSSASRYKTKSKRIQGRKKSLVTPGAGTPKIRFSAREGSSKGSRGLLTQPEHTPRRPDSRKKAVEPSNQSVDSKSKEPNMGARKPSRGHSRSQKCVNDDSGVSDPANKDTPRAKVVIAPKRTKLVFKKSDEFHSHVMEAGAVKRKNSGAGNKNGAYVNAGRPEATSLSTYHKNGKESLIKSNTIHKQAIPPAGVLRRSQSPNEELYKPRNQKNGQKGQNRPQPKSRSKESKKTPNRSGEVRRLGSVHNNKKLDVVEWQFTKIQRVPEKQEKGVIPLQGVYQEKVRPSQQSRSSYPEPIRSEREPVVVRKKLYQGEGVYSSNMDSGALSSGRRPKEVIRGVRRSLAVGQSSGGGVRESREQHVVKVRRNRPSINYKQKYADSSGLGDSRGSEAVGRSQEVAKK